MSIARKIMTGGAGESPIEPIGPSDPHFATVSLLLDGDGTNGANNNTFTDSSDNNLAVTPTMTGSACQIAQGSVSPYGDNWSNYFDNASNAYRLLFAKHYLFDLGAGNFTVEAWIYKVGTGARIAGNEPETYAGIIGGNDRLTAGWTLYLRQDTGALCWFGDDGALRTTTNKVNDKEWTHVAVSRSSGTLKIFINGVEGYSAPVTTYYTVPYGISIGRDYGANASFYGYISNARVVRGTGLYTTNFTPSTSPLTAVTNTVLLTCQSNRFQDNSLNKHPVTLSGNPEVVSVGPYAAKLDMETDGSSAYFDGSDNVKLSVDASEPFWFGVNDFTVECFFYQTRITDDFTIVGATKHRNSYFGFGNLGTGGMAIFSGSGDSARYSGAQSIPPLNQWNHLVWQRNNGRLQMYLNGTRVYDGVYSFDFGSDATGFTVGSSLSYPYKYEAKGYISDFRVIKGAAFYDGATIAVPTAPLGASGAQLLLKGADAGIYDLAGKKNVKTLGAAAISTAQKKYGKSSIFFSDTHSRLVVPEKGHTLTFGMADFTIESWIYITKNVTSFIFDWRDVSQSSNHGWMPTLYIERNYITYYALGSPRINSSSISNRLNQWIHVAVVRFGNKTTLYLDGITQGYFTDPNSYIGPKDGNVYIGGSSTGLNFNGYMDDFRITKGVARYTGNFTPPTEALPKY